MHRKTYDIEIMRDNSEEKFPLVDEEGNVIGSATRGECHNGSRLLHAVVHLHVFNSKGEVYLQRRPDWKDIQPGKWDTSVGGHIDLGETPELALVREVREELGITEFMFCIDMETGVLLKYLAYDFNGDCVQTMLMRNIAFDSKAEKVRDLTSEEIESSGTETLPEVMAVRGINGCTGFIKVDELIDGSNISIGRESERVSEKCIDVYDNDLHTAIDKIIL